MFACVCVGVRAYVCVYVRAEGGEGMIRLGRPARFLWQRGNARNVFHVYIITINYCQIWKVLVVVYQLCGMIVPVSLARLP